MTCFNVHGRNRSRLKKRKKNERKKAISFCWKHKRTRSSRNDMSKLTVTNVFCSVCFKSIFLCLAVSWMRNSRLHFHLFSLIWPLEQKASCSRKHLTNQSGQHFSLTPCSALHFIFASTITSVFFYKYILCVQLKKCLQFEEKRFCKKSVKTPEWKTLTEMFEIAVQCIDFKLILVYDVRLKRLSLYLETFDNFSVLLF